MKWLRRVVLLLAAVFAVAVAAWWMLAPRIVESVRRRAEEDLTRALGSEVHLNRLALDATHFRVELGELAIGLEAQTARLGSATLRLLPYSSLLQRRPVFELDADGVFFDVVKLPKRPPQQPREQKGIEAIPSFRVRRAHLTNAHVILPGGPTPFDLAAGGIEIELSTRPGGRLRGRARIEGLRAVRGGRPVELRKVDLAMRHTAQGFLVDRLQADGDALHVDAALDGEHPLRHSVRLKADVGIVARLDPHLADLSGSLEAEGAVDGSLEKPIANARVRARPIAWRAETLDDLDADLGWQSGRLEVRSARGQGFGGSLDLTGSMGTSGDLPFDARGSWTGIDVARVAASAGVALGRELASDGQVNGSGTLDPPVVDGTAEGAFDERDGAHIDWNGTARATRSEQRIELTASQGGSNTVRAAASLDAERRLDGNVEVALGNTSSLARLFGARDVPAIAGTLRATARVSGTADHPELQGNVSGRDVAALGVRITRVDADVRVDRERVESRAVEIAVGSGTARASGTVGLAPSVENEWQAEATNIGLADVGTVARALGHAVPLTGGSLSFAARGSGPWSAPVVRADANARDIGLAGEHFQQLTVAAAATWPRWNAALELVHGPDELLSARSSGEALRELSVDVGATRWSLAGLAAGRDAGLTGEVSVQAKVSGPPAALSGEASVQTRNLAWREREIGDTEVRAQVQRGVWNASADLLDGALRTKARVVPGAEFALDAELADAHLARFLSDNPTLTVDASGTLHLAGRFGDVRRLGGDLDLAKLAIASGSFRADAPRGVRVRGANGSFAIESFHLEGSGTELDVTGTVDTSGGAKLSAHGGGSLQLLEAIGKPIESVRGSFTVAVDLQRDPGAVPQLTGTLDLRDAALDAGLPFGPTDTDGSFRFDHSVVAVERFGGRLGGGTFAIGGSVDLASGPALTWKLDQVSTGIVPSLEHEISGHGTFDGTWEKLKVSGELEILRALYEKRIEVRDFLPSFRRELAKAPEEAGAAPTRQIEIDLHVFAPDELYIDNNFARVEGQADLRIGGTTQQPELTGRVQLLNGQVFFRGRTFEVRTAVVDFRRELGLKGYVNVVADSEIVTPEATYTVTLQITGSTDNVRVVMSADDPALTQNDIVSLIAFGRTTAQLQKEGGGVSVGDLLELAPGGGYTEKVQRGTAKVLHVDRFEIEPAFSRTTGQFEPQLNVGKNFTEDFSASLMSTFGVAGRQALELSYRVTTQFSLLGGWESESENQKSAFSAIARFRFSFRDTPGFSLLHGRTRREAHAR